ncbi:hypothetical protein GCM10010400_69900 [Streptomyces aculeolatus]|uniref:DUF6221 family protein n=1 Tax=Streptomyces aculeolatus TaxID=270689 RepID=UPI001CEC9C5C|nr:DUF6221 family protein [Streptomyces aculeolatus]
MTADLVAFLRARLDDSHAALIRYRDGHDGPCLNMPGQRPEDYDEYDSCYLHIETAGATPYRDVAFGLADIDAKRRILDLHHAELVEVTNADGDERSGRWCSECDGEQFPCQTLRLLAVPHAGHPEWRSEWRP